jgi:hypothetical protein
MIRPVDRSLPACSGRRFFALAYLVAFGAFGGCGGPVSPEQKEAIARIQDLGGQVNFKRGGYEIDLKTSVVENEDLALLSKIPNLKVIDLDGTRVGDEGMQHLQAIRSLEMVSLQRTAVTREGIANLKKALPKIDVKH